MFRYSAIRDIVEVSSNIPKVYLYFDYLFSFIIEELNQHRSSAVFSYFFSFSNYKNSIEFNSQIAGFSCFPVLRNLCLRLINSNLITENANVITKKKKVRRKEI